MLLLCSSARVMPELLGWICGILAWVAGQSQGHSQLSCLCQEWVQRLAASKLCLWSVPNCLNSFAAGKRLSSLGLIGHYCALWTSTVCRCPLSGSAWRCSFLRNYHLHTESSLSHFSGPEIHTTWGLWWRPKTSLSAFWDLPIQSALRWCQTRDLGSRFLR